MSTYRDDVKPDYLTPRERKEYGITATLVDTKTGELKTEVFRGNVGVGDATRECAAFCDSLGPTWRVRTISTPVSISADLRNHGSQRPMSYFTEHSLLGRIGRPDLIERLSKQTGLRAQARQGKRRKAW